MTGGWLGGISCLGSIWRYAGRRVNLHEGVTVESEAFLLRVVVGDPAFQSGSNLVSEGPLGPII